MPIQLSGSLVITGSITTTGVITMSGSIASASYSSNSDLLQGTGSVGFTTTGSFATMSGSVSSRVSQIETVYATTGSNSFRATQSITGSLTVTGQITAQTLNVQQVTSSIIYSSGSNVFGCDINSRQTFTGSFYQTGSFACFMGNLVINKSQPDIMPNITDSTQYARLIFFETGSERGGIQQIGAQFPNARKNRLEIFSPNGGGISFVPAGVFLSPVMHLTGSNVGVNTIAPTHTLEVEGTLRYYNSSTNAELKVSRAATCFGSGIGLYTGATHNWLLGTAWGETSNNFILYNVNTSKQILRGDYSTNGISIGTDHSNLGSAALNVYSAGTGGGNAGSQIWLKGGNSNVSCNSNSIVFSYSDVVLYSHAIKTTHNSAAINCNSIDFYVWNYGTDSTTTVGTRKVMSVDGVGVIKPLQPAFQVHRGQGADCFITNTAEQRIAFPCTRFDVGNNTSNCGLFRAPLAGRYSFSSTVRYDGATNLNSYLRLFFAVNGCSGCPAFTYGHTIAGPGSYSSDYYSMSISTVLNLGVGDCVTVNGGLNSGTVGVQFESQFSGYFLG